MAPQTVLLVFFGAVLLVGGVGLLLIIQEPEVGPISQTTAVVRNLESKRVCNAGGGYASGYIDCFDRPWVVLSFSGGQMDPALIRFLSRERQRIAVSSEASQHFEVGMQVDVVYQTVLYQPPLGCLYTRMC